MEALVDAFVGCAADAFGLTGPVYQLGFSRDGGWGHWVWPGEKLPEGAAGAKGGPMVRRMAFRPAPSAGRVAPGAGAGTATGSGRGGPATPAGAFWVDPGWVRGGPIGRLPLADGAAGTVLWIDGLTGVLARRRAAAEMMRIVAPGGALLVWASAEVSGPGSGGWRLTAHGLDRLLSGLEVKLVGWQGGQRPDKVVYGIGFKPPVDGSVVRGVDRFLAEFPGRLEWAVAGRGWRARLRRWLGVVGKSGRRAPRASGRGEVQWVVDFSVEGELRGYPRSS